MFEQLHHNPGSGSALSYRYVHALELATPMRYAAVAVQRSLERAAEAVTKAAGKAHRGWVRHRTHAALASLPNHALHDIGFHRSEIGRVAMEIEQGIDPRRPGR